MKFPIFAKRYLLRYYHKFGATFMQQIDFGCLQATLKQESTCIIDLHKLKVISGNCVDCHTQQTYIHVLFADFVQHVNKHLRRSLLTNADIHAKELIMTEFSTYKIVCILVKMFWLIF